jgi:D-alanyl-D-alanine carboxypeptidase/D-alanyl-D-alanine-endopeptidase (penicillin-binding protein 4)
MDSIFSAIQKKIIKKITGKIITDGSVFDDMLPSGWEWDDMGNYYGAGASGICMFENAYKVFLKPGNKEGDTVEIVKTIPEMSGLRFINTLTTSVKGSDDDIYIYGGPNSNLRFIDGPAPLGQSSVEVKGSMPEPDMFCSKYLWDFLFDKKMKIVGSWTSDRELRWENKSDTLKRKTIYVYKSPELGKILYYTNLSSVNLFAEALLKMAGNKKFGKGSTNNGIKAVVGFWKNKGINLEGCVINDGCGLSRRNQISTLQFCDMLIKYTKDVNFEVFNNSLPIAGRTGTLRNMFKNTSAENNLRAKSGTMGDIKSYAGYVNNKKGEKIAFAVIANNYNCSNGEIRKKIEKILVLLADAE